MKLAAFSVLIAGGVLATSACGVRTQTTDISPSPAKGITCQNAVVVYSSRAEVPSSYREVAWIEAQGNSVWTTDNQMRDQMRKKAADAGANGLIANAVSENKVGVNVIGEAVGAHTATAESSGLAIWIPADAGHTRQLCGS